MSKKREKRLVVIEAIYNYSVDRMVSFKYNVGTIPYRGTITVGLTEDPWPKIKEYFDDSGHVALLQQEREV